MVIYFPSIYQEECLYSLKARWLKNTLSSQVGCSSVLGDIGNQITSIDLPYHLGALYEATKHIAPWSLESMIKDGTLYPAYGPFLTNKKQEQVVQAMISSKRRNIQGIIGINTSNLTRSRFPKFCPVCGDDDIRKYSEAYWHRVHQIPEIQICPDHGCLLIDYVPEIGQLSGFKYFLPSVDLIHKSRIIFNTCKTLSKISTDFKDILLGKSKFNVNQVNYISKVETRGYFKNGQLQRRDLQEAFSFFFKETKNEYLRSRISDSYYWIGDIVYHPTKVFNPFQHLLFSRFIEELNFKLVPRKEHPFGNGPWKCFNKASDHYLKDSIKEMCLEIDKTNNRFVGIFECECGMIYSKYFAKKNGVLREHVRIKERGKIWMDKMHECIVKGFSKRETARVLGTDASTVVNLLKKVTPKEAPRAIALLTSKRKEWQAALNEFDFNRYTQAREKHQSLYKWLLKYDSEWLFLTKSQSNAISPGTQLKLDWNKLDDELTIEIKEVIKKLKNDKSNVRISKTLIGRLAHNGRYILTTNLKNLPKTRDFLASKAESINEFQIRRIKHAIGIISTEGRSLTTSNVLRQSKIRRHSATVTRKIELLIQKHEMNY